MSVWKSDEKLLIFASLISPSKIIVFEKPTKKSATTATYHKSLHFAPKNSMLMT